MIIVYHMIINGCTVPELAVAVHEHEEVKVRVYILKNWTELVDSIHKMRNINRLYERTKYKCTNK